MCYWIWGPANLIIEWEADVYFNKTKSLLGKSFFFLNFLIIREKVHYETPFRSRLSPTYFWFMPPACVPSSYTSPSLLIPTGKGRPASITSHSSSFSWFFTSCGLAQLSGYPDWYSKPAAITKRRFMAELVKGRHFPTSFPIFSVEDIYRLRKFQKVYIQTIFKIAFTNEFQVNLFLLL